MWFRRWFVITNAVAGNVSDVVLGVAANSLAELLITLWRALWYRRSIVRSERMTEAKEMYERYSRNAVGTFDGRVMQKEDADEVTMMKMYEEKLREAIKRTKEPLNRKKL